MEHLIPATLSMPRPLALFVTLPTIAKDVNISPEKAGRNLALIGVIPDGALEYGDRLIPIFTSERAKEVGEKLEQLR